MKFNSIRLILFLSIIAFLSSCLGTTTDVTTLSTNPSFSSLTFAANDSALNIQSAKFILTFDQTSNDSIIVNQDSLVYKANIKHLKPTFTFKSSSSAEIIYTDKPDTVHITGKDTIDFTRPLKIINVPADGDIKKSREYIVKVNVHKVEPELYVWKRLNESIDDNDNPSSQKTVWFNGQLNYYMNDGIAAYLYTSVNGTSWNSGSLSGIPTKTPLGDMLQFNGKLFLSQDGANIYSSSDGASWTYKTVTEYVFKSLLYVFDAKLWAVIQSNSDSKLHFANSVDGDTWIVIGEIPQNFPVRDFASISFTTRNGKPKVLVIGGYSNDSIVLKNRWSSEDGVYWLDFSMENHSLDSLAIGASVIAYDNKLLLFGGKIKNNLIVEDHYRQSIDEGLSWQKTDSAYNLLREPVYTKVSDIKTDTTYINYVPRSYQSAVVDNSNRIYLVGGKRNYDFMSDVWTGKLNRKGFIKQ